MIVLYKKEISFRFKGNRAYVHGTDMFDKILENVKIFFQEYPTRIKGSFHRPLTSNAILRIYDNDDKIEHKNPYAHFSIYIKKNAYQIIIDSTNSQIYSSYDYKEEEVLSKMVIEKETAKMTAKYSYTYIEQMVAMTKKLHLTIYPDATPKWLFTRIEIKDALNPVLYPNHELAIKAIKNFHYKLTQNAILLDDNLLGNIWFSIAL